MKISLKYHLNYFLLLLIVLVIYILFCFLFSSFEPCWNIVKTSTEILANSYTQAVQELHELIKTVREYGETQKENQKTVCCKSKIEKHLQGSLAYNM